MASRSNDQDSLANLLQMGTMAKYQSVFENLINRVTRIPEFLLKSFYIYGLKPALQWVLLRSRPTTLGEAFSLARITEAGFEDKRSTIAIAKPNDLTASIQVQDLKQTTQGRGDEPNRILLDTISPFGYVDKVVVFQKSASFQALIQFQSRENAIATRNSL
ncbi:polypyrimidine tract-binding protein homolog 3 [Tanacetum coccineum]